MDTDKLFFYKHIVKRHLNDIWVHIESSKSEMEKRFYCGRYAVQLCDYAQALGIQEKILERYVKP